MSTTSSTTHFRGRVITVTVDEVILPNEQHAQLEIVHHPGGAAVVALDSQSRVCLLRQFRHAARGWLWELPAGKLEAGEPPLETARRELIEEAGVAARHWTSLGTYISSPGVFTEVVHLYLAIELTPATASPEEHEVFEVRWLPLEEARQWAVEGTLSDGKSALGVLRAVHRIAESGTPGAAVP